MGPDKQVPNIRKPVTVYGRCGGNYIYGRLAFANIRSAKVSESELLRFFENVKWQWAWMGLPRSATPEKFWSHPPARVIHAWVCARVGDVIPTRVARCYNVSPAVASVT